MYVYACVHTCRLQSSVQTLKKDLIDENRAVKESAPYQAPVDRRREALEKKNRREKAAIEADMDSSAWNF